MEGVAIYWKSDKFECLSQMAVRFDGIPASQIHNKPQCGVVIALKVINPDLHTVGESTQKEHVIIVATTHLIFNNNRGDIKLASLMLML